MAQLSEIAQAFKEQMNAKHAPGKPGMRTSSRQPAVQGFARGAAGSMGSKLFKGRNSMKGEQKELETLNSPMFLAYMQSMMGLTPVTDSMRGK